MLPQLAKKRVVDIFFLFNFVSLEKFRLLPRMACMRESNLSLKIEYVCACSMCYNIIYYFTYYCNFFQLNLLLKDIVSYHEFEPELP